MADEKNASKEQLLRSDEVVIQQKERCFKNQDPVDG